MSSEIVDFGEFYNSERTIALEICVDKMVQTRPTRL